MSDNAPEFCPKGFLRSAFQFAVQPALDGLRYVSTNYPGKATAVTGLAADALFIWHSLASKNYLGVYGGLIGMYASTHLLIFSDRKITQAEKENFVDPQDQRNITNWVNHPTQYPWEYAGLIRMMAMSSMLLGGMGFSGNNQMHYGEAANAGFALVGYFIKMFIAERERGSVPIPSDSHGLLRNMFQAKAFVQERPNTAAGAAWNIGLAFYTLEALIKGEHTKLASAAVYAFPNVFTMLSSKRAKVLTNDSGPTAGQP